MNKWAWTWGPLVLLATWLVVGLLGLNNPLFIPSLPEVISSSARMLSEGTLLQDLMSTARRTILGFLGAAVLGVPLGLALGSSIRLRQTTAVLVDFFRSVPGIAMFPLFLLFFGIGDSSKIANAIFAGGLIMVVNSMYGVRNANITRITAAKIMGAGRVRIYVQVILPNALPEIVGGLRIAMSISLVVIVVTEMFVGTSLGLGKRIFGAYQLFRISDMYVAIIATGLLGYCLNFVIELLERRIVHWGGK